MKASPSPLAIAAIRIAVGVLEARRRREVEALERRAKMAAVQDDERTAAA